MAQRERTVQERIGDWQQAYVAVRASLTTVEMRTMVTEMTKAKPEDVGGSIEAYAGLVNSSMALSSVVAANDRTAAQVAEAMTRNGLTREKETPL